MQSKTMQNEWSAQYADGQSAKSWSCKIRLEAGGLAIDRGRTEEVITWPYSALRSHTLVSRGGNEVIIETNDATAAQLLVRDATVIERLARVAPQITASGTRRGWITPLLIATAVIVGLFVLAWQLNIRPAGTLARLIPDSARQTLGSSVMQQFIAKNKVCNAPAGRAALTALATRLLAGTPNAQNYDVIVVDLPINNAFAVPGGRMLITNKLIQTAQSPDEVAGVLAHEIGHGIERHPEAGMIRAFGLSFLLELMTGGSSGAISNLSMLILQTGYMRQDEFAADKRALALLKKAGISQKGLGAFFARNAKSAISSSKASCEQGGKEAGECANKKDSTTTAWQTFNIMRTHPYPKERLKVVRKTEAYTSTPALTETQWQALRRICGKS